MSDLLDRCPRQATDSLLVLPQNLFDSSFGLRAPNIGGKLVIGVNELRVILIFNIAYDSGIFPGERYRVNMAGCYQIMCYIGVRSAEFVDVEKTKLGSVIEIFGRKTVISSICDNDDGKFSDDGEADGEGDKEEPLDEELKRLDELLSQEIVGRGRPKALCYE